MNSSGILVVDKPSGITSHDVVARARRIFNTRKVGHAGTLDPMATGVIVIGINDATRMLGYLTLSRKVYLGTIRLGASSSTDDSEGDLSAIVDTGSLTEDQIAHSLSEQVGLIEQIPSSVSAVRVNGRRAHAIMRSGGSVELPPRAVEVQSIDVLQIVRRNAPFTDVDICVTCSAGTFVRAIARDVGRDLDVGGHLVALRRVSSGPFTLKQANSLSDLERSVHPWDYVESMGRSAQEVWPCITVTDQDREKISKGQRIPSEKLPEHETLALLGTDGALLAIVSNSSLGMTYRAVFIGVS